MSQAALEAWNAYSTNMMSMKYHEASVIHHESAHPETSRLMARLRGACKELLFHELHTKSESIWIM